MPRCLTRRRAPRRDLLEIPTIFVEGARSAPAEDSTFSGHSLDEFSALASVANILSNSARVDIVFYPGPAMQLAVERGKQGGSNHAVCARNRQRQRRGASAVFHAVI